MALLFAADDLFAAEADRLQHRLLQALNDSVDDGSAGIVVELPDAINAPVK